MRRKNGLYRIIAFGCIFMAVVTGVAPNVLAGSVTAPEGAYGGILSPGSGFSGEEIAALSASEANAEDLAEIASGSALALIGAVVVVYLVWMLLQSN